MSPQESHVVQPEISQQTPLVPKSTVPYGYSSHYPFPEATTLTNDHHVGPMPTVNKILSEDLSLLPEIEFFKYQGWIYRIINFHTVYRLGVVRALTVLIAARKRPSPTSDLKYETINRPFQIEQPPDCPLIPAISPISELEFFVRAVRTEAFFVGLQSAAFVLIEANVEEIPQVNYHIKRNFEPISTSLPVANPVTAETDSNVGHLVSAPLPDSGPRVAGPETDLDVSNVVSAPPPDTASQIPPAEESGCNISTGQTATQSDSSGSSSALQNNS